MNCILIDFFDFSSSFSLFVFYSHHLFIVITSTNIKYCYVYILFLDVITKLYFCEIYDKGIKGRCKNILKIGNYKLYHCEKHIINKLFAFKIDHKEANSLESDLAPKNWCKSYFEGDEYGSYRNTIVIFCSTLI